MESEIVSPAGTPRRDFLKMAGAGAGAVALSLVPLRAEATPESVMAAIGKLIGEKAVKEGRMKMVLAEIAENGGTVPFSVSVDSPMTAADHVKALHIFADGNPSPDVASYFFGPHNGKAGVSIRLRLAKSQAVVAVAEMNNGDVFIGRRKIKVTIGGCGG